MVVAKEDIKTAESMKPERNNNDCNSGVGVYVDYGYCKTNPVVNWFEEKKKLLSTKKNHGANSKIQFAKTKESILNLFKSKKNESQD